MSPLRKGQQKIPLHSHARGNSEFYYYYKASVNGMTLPVIPL